MTEEGEFDEMPKSYLVQPNSFSTEGSRLNENEDLSMAQFPMLYGAWVCLPVIQMFGMSYTDCMRFLPAQATSEDPRFSDSVKAMTYLTSRAIQGDNTLAAGNETMEVDTASVFKSFTVDLMGAWSGISQVGLALATAVLV